MEVGGFGYKDKKGRNERMNDLRPFSNVVELTKILNLPITGQKHQSIKQL